MNRIVENGRSQSSRDISARINWSAYFDLGSMQNMFPSMRLAFGSSENIRLGVHQQGLCNDRSSGDPSRQTRPVDLKLSDL